MSLVNVVWRLVYNEAKKLICPLEVVGRSFNAWFEPYNVQKMVVGAHVLTLHACIWSLASCVDTSRYIFNFWFFSSCVHFLLMCQHLHFTDSILVSVFSKLDVTSSLLEIFEHRLLRWKLEFRGYNLGSKISSFGLVKTERILSEVDLSGLLNSQKLSLTEHYSFSHTFLGEIH